ncbi:MAG: cytidine deaminase [Desulfobacteraceae bacterium 4572_130]|nr:MAG: cytidine deaminase [Desulfobacteraceae bacterium 4572_130]
MNDYPLLRPSWHKYFMDIAKLVGTRSTCIRRKVGAVLVKNKRILSSGYNGAPSGMDHCITIGCLRKQLNVPSGERHELCRGVHGEQNAIIQAAYYGISIKDSILYCTNQPCSICAKIIINAGIKKIYFDDEYNDLMAKKMFNDAKIKLIPLKDD